jgi:glycosyltransferase involved in cell wall biosynthesis
MKILISSYVFYPSIGGIETVTALLAGEFHRLGHEVTVVTPTPYSGDNPFPFRVVRQPMRKDLLKILRQSDIYFQNNVSLQMAWPLLLVRKPWIIAHHTWLHRPDGSEGWQTHLKRFLCKFAINITVSNAVASELSCPADVIGNPYDDKIFSLRPGIPKTRDLIYVGRLVSEKGVDLLISAVKQLTKESMTPLLTIVGEGPEGTKLQEQVARLDLQNQVQFLGKRVGWELSEILNAHRILVIPTRGRETFGIAALEGIACGCVPIGSSGGGLAEAIGPCGGIFDNGRVESLADMLKQLLLSTDRLDGYRSCAPEHLRQFQLQTIAEKYLAIFKRSVTPTNHPPTNVG